MDLLTIDMINQIISLIVPSACYLALAFLLCETIFQFFIRLIFPKRFKD